MIKKSLLSLIVFLTSNAAYAELAFIAVFHKKPVDIIQQVKPFLAEGDSIIAGHNELIIRTEAANLKDIKNIIKRLDQAYHQLLILVKRGKQGPADDSNLDATTQLKLGQETSLQTALNYSANSKKTTERITQRINVLDSHPAFIEEGKIEALATVRALPFGHLNSSYLHKATTGFYLTPYLVGDAITLHISPWATKSFRNKQGLADTSKTSTVIRGKLNQWIEVSGVSRQSNKQQTGTLSKRYQTHQSHQSVWVKVIKLKQ